MTVTPPKPVAAYFVAANTGGADHVTGCFADDAVVRDEGGEYRGRDAIRGWAEEVRRKYHFHAEVIAVREAADRTIVTAHLTGDFPGNPVDLRYQFKLAGSRMMALEIG